MIYLIVKIVVFRYKIVDIKREPGRETGFPLFFSD